LKWLSICLALYISHSRFKHSCTPDGQLVFFGKKAVLRSTQHRFPSDKTIDQLTVARVNTMVCGDSLCFVVICVQMPREMRRDALYREFYQTCNCDACTNEFLEQRMLSAKCQRINDDHAVMATCDGRAICYKKAQADESSDVNEEWVCNTCKRHLTLGTYKCVM
jgi:hypothetical protein